MRKQTARRSVRRFAGGALASMVVLATAACPAAEPPPPDGLPAPAALTDANIASIAITANQAEVQRAQLARERATRSDVRSFAEMLHRDHQAAVTELRRVTTARGISPVEEAITRQLEQNQAQALQTLRAYDGAAFDRAYIDLEIENHRWMLESIDRALLPGARDRDLQRLLREARPTVAMHLREAERIRAALPAGH